ncbi:hypothetical protein VKT23_015646 [Stygiomarasmius scandens]|uniref:OTU domain-containing protein n=1 Tax=Marasmiellus scandens TaxID=2682957 RepID=A0ABR1IX49_9AGAR
MGSAKKQNKSFRTRSTRSSGRANLLTSDPSQNTALLNEQLRSLGLYAAPTLGDGNCLFRALSDQYYGSPSRHADVRRDICDYIEAHPERYEGFVDVDEFSDTGERKGKGGGLAAYVAGMRQNATYGGHMELSAFAHLTKRNIKVIQPGLVYVIQWDPSPSPSTPRKPKSASSSTSDSPSRRTRSHDGDGDVPMSPRRHHGDGEAEEEAKPQGSGPTIYVAYHDWEHFSSIRSLRGPHTGIPNVQETPAPEGSNPSAAPEEKLSPAKARKKERELKEKERREAKQAKAKEKATAKETKAKAKPPSTKEKEPAAEPLSTGLKLKIPARPSSAIQAPVPTLPSSGNISPLSSLSPSPAPSLHANSSSSVDASKVPLPASQPVTQPPSVNASPPVSQSPSPAPGQTRPQAQSKAAVHAATAPSSASTSQSNLPASASATTSTVTASNPYAAYPYYPYAAYPYTMSLPMNPNSKTGVTSYASGYPHQAYQGGYPMYPTYPYTYPYATAFASGSGTSKSSSQPTTGVYPYGYTPPSASPATVIPISTSVSSTTPNTTGISTTLSTPGGTSGPLSAPSPSTTQPPTHYALLEHSTMTSYPPPHPTTIPPNPIYPNPYTHIAAIDPLSNLSHLTHLVPPPRIQRSPKRSFEESISEEGSLDSIDSNSYAGSASGSNSESKRSRVDLVASARVSAGAGAGAEDDEVMVVDTTPDSKRCERSDSRGRKSRMRDTIVPPTAPENERTFLKSDVDMDDVLPDISDPQHGGGEDQTRVEIEAEASQSSQGSSPPHTTPGLSPDSGSSESSGHPGSSEDGDVEDDLPEGNEDDDADGDYEHDHEREQEEQEEQEQEEDDEDDDDLEPNLNHTLPVSNKAPAKAAYSRNKKNASLPPGERPLTRRERKKLGLPKPRAAAAAGGGAGAGVGKIVIPGGKYATRSSTQRAGTGAVAEGDEGEWKANGTGRVDVRGFRELKI